MCSLSAAEVEEECVAGLDYRVAVRYDVVAASAYHYNLLSACTAIPDRFSVPRTVLDDFSLYEFDRLFAAESLGAHDDGVAFAENGLAVWYQR